MKSPIEIAMVFPTVLVLLSCGQSHNIEDVRKNHTIDDLGVYLENPTPVQNDTNRYTVDNKVYRINRQFIFDYYIVRNGDTLKVVAPRSVNPGVDFQRDWSFIPHRAKHEDKIETISISVLPGISNDNQTMLKYEYQYASIGYNTFSSTSGVIENEMNTWMHPHRDKYFMILELNPFPFIQQPIEVGSKWSWSLGIGDHWSDNRWRAWTGSIKNQYEYEILGREKLLTRIGEMDCWIVQGTATSSIGSTGLIAYYSEVHGFVKLDYINIDKSRLTIEIVGIR